MSGPYILRYYLPCEPIYPAEVTARRGEALITFCKKTGIDAVMLYVDLDPNWYYLPDSVEHTDYYLPLVEALGKRLAENGISYQLNYQNLFGSWDGGCDMRHVNNWENFVDQEGLESYGVGCSIGERFRAVAGRKLRSWAATRPDVLWIDDDIRMTHHRASVRELWAGKIREERKDFGCFCDAHIARFNKRVGGTYTREEIKNGILRGDALRHDWLAFQGDEVDELCCWIAKTVREVSPETKVAVMTSKPDAHSAEGRHWKEFLTNLSDGEIPILRPTFGPYIEKDPTAFHGSYAAYEQLKADLRATYGTEVDFCPEIENTRFTRWSKSLAATGYQLALASFLGSRRITLSLYDLDGCVLEEEPEFGDLLTERRPFLDRMAALDLWNAKAEGVGLVTAPDRIKDTTHPVEQMGALSQGRFWDSVLLPAGIPCQYITPQDFGEAKSAVLDGYTAQLLAEEELRTLLTKRVLLDSKAAQLLCARGLGEALGVSVGEKVPCIGGREIFHTLSHTDGSMVQAPLRIEGGKWRELILQGAEALTHIVTPDGVERPGFTRFENALGGTVYVFAADGGRGDGFYSNFRIRLLKEICAHLAGCPGAGNRSYATVAVRSKGDRQFIFAAPLAADCWRHVEFTLPKPPKTAVFYDLYGGEHPAEIAGNTVICKDAALHTYESVVCVIGY